MPTKTKKPKPDEFYICIQSFAGNELAVAEGDLFPGDHEFVRRFPDRFVVVGTPEEEIRRLKIAAAVPPPPPEPLARVKLRVLPGQGISTLDGGGPPQTVEQGGRTYLPGDTLEAEGADAQYLIDGGFCEVVESLPKKLVKAGQAIATGRTEV
jgi:hypothetical protein